MWRQEARWKMTNKIKWMKVKKTTFEKINKIYILTQKIKEEKRY